MATAGLQVQLSVKEIYAVCCEKCRLKIKALIKTRITDQMVDQVIGVEEG